MQGSAVSQAFFSSHYFYFTTATKEERRGNKTKPKKPKKSSSTCCPLLQHLRFEQLYSYGLASSLQVLLCDCRVQELFFVPLSKTPTKNSSRVIFVHLCSCYVSRRVKNTKILIRKQLSTQTLLVQHSYKYIYKHIQVLWTMIF